MLLSASQKQAGASQMVLSLSVKDKFACTEMLCAVLSMELGLRDGGLQQGHNSQELHLYCPPNGQRCDRSAYYNDNKLSTKHSLIWHMEINWQGQLASNCLHVQTLYGQERKNAFRRTIASGTLCIPS